MGGRDRQTHGWIVENSVISDNLKEEKFHHGEVVPIQGVGSRLCGVRGRDAQDHCCSGLGCFSCKCWEQPAAEGEEASTGVFLYRFVCSVTEILPHLKRGPRLHKGQPHLDVQHRGAPGFKTSSTLNVKLLFKFQGF